jgi:hypothetical protein
MATRPEVRTDKNGRSVTRHVKIDDGASTVRDIPAAAPVAPVVRKSPTNPDFTGEPKFGGKMTAHKTSDGGDYFSEEHPPNPNQPNRYPTFTLTSEVGTVTVQKHDDGQFYDGGKEWAGNSLDSVANYYI